MNRNNALSKNSKFIDFLKSWKLKKNPQKILSGKRPTWKQSLSNFIQVKRCQSCSVENHNFKVCKSKRKREDLSAIDCGDFITEKLLFNSSFKSDGNSKHFNFDLSICQENSFSCITFYFIQDLITNDIIAETTKNGSLILINNKTCSITVETPFFDNSLPSKRKRSKKLCHKHSFLIKENAEKVSLESAQDLSLTLPCTEAEKNYQAQLKRVVLRPIMLKKSASYGSIPQQFSRNAYLNKSNNVTLISPQNLGSCQKEIFVVSVSDATILENWVADMDGRKSFFSSVDQLTTTAESIHLDENVNCNNKNERTIPNLEISSHCNKPSFNAIFGVIYRLKSPSLSDKSKISLSTILQSTLKKENLCVSNEEGRCETRVSLSLLHSRGDAKENFKNAADNRGDNASKHSNESPNSTSSSPKFQNEADNLPHERENTLVNLECFHLDFKWLYQNIYDVVADTIKESRRLEEIILNECILRIFSKMRDRLIKNSKIRIVRKVVKTKQKSLENKKEILEKKVVFCDKDEQINYILKDIISSFDSLAGDKSVDDTIGPDSKAFELDQIIEKNSSSAVGNYESDDVSNLHNDTTKSLSGSKWELVKPPVLDLKTILNSAKLSKSPSISQDINKSQKSKSEKSANEKSADEVKPKIFLQKEFESQCEISKKDEESTTMKRMTSKSQTILEPVLVSSVNDSHVISPVTQCTLHPPTIKQEKERKSAQCYPMEDKSECLNENIKFNSPDLDFADLLYSSMDELQGKSTNSQTCQTNEKTFIMQEEEVKTKDLRKHHKRDSFKRRYKLNKTKSLLQNLNVQSPKPLFNDLEDSNMNNSRKLSLTCSTETSLSKSNIDSLLSHLKDFGSSEDSKASQELNDFFYESINQTAAIVDK